MSNLSLALLFVLRMDALGDEGVKEIKVGGDAGKMREAVLPRLLAR